jgi:hypothetical protein
MTRLIPLLILCILAGHSLGSAAAHRYRQQAQPFVPLPACSLTVKGCGAAVNGNWCTGWATVDCASHPGSGTACGTVSVTLMTWRRDPFSGLYEFWEDDCQAEMLSCNEGLYIYTAEIFLSSTFEWRTEVIVCAGDCEPGGCAVPLCDRVQFWGE